MKLQSLSPTPKKLQLAMQLRRLALALLCFGGATYLYWQTDLIGFVILLALLGFIAVSLAVLIPYAHTVPVQLLLQIGGALCWGAFFSVMPIMEVLVFGVVIWLPVLLYCEWHRTKRYVFLPGALLRALTILLLTGAAMYAPMKYVDQEVGPFPTPQLTLTELRDALEPQHVYLHIPETHARLSVRVPHKVLPLHVLISLIEAQTDLQHEIGYCGNGVSLLRGAHPISGVRFHSRGKQNLYAS